jgi:hypothetical protein
VQQADERLPLVTAQRVPNEHHRLPLHPRQKVQAVKPTYSPPPRHGPG